MPVGGQDPDANDGSTEVCIKIAADGSLSVYTETADTEETAEQGAQPAPDVRSALKIAAGMIVQAQQAAGAASPQSQSAGFAAAS
jgi:hypothetical protein